MPIAQRDGHPAEYRWRPLFSAAKFGWRPIYDMIWYDMMDYINVRPKADV